MPDEDDEPETLPVLEPTINVADEKQNRRRATAKKLRERDAAEFWRGVFASPIGRSEMWEILAQLHTFEVQFAVTPGGFADPNATWFHAGEQASGHRLFLSWLKQDREGVMLMLAEKEYRLKPS